MPIEYIEIEPGNNGAAELPAVAVGMRRSEYGAGELVSVYPLLEMLARLEPTREEFPDVEDLPLQERDLF